MDDSIQRLLGAHDARSPRDGAPMPAPLARVFAHPTASAATDDVPTVGIARMGDKILIASG